MAAITRQNAALVEQAVAAALVKPARSAKPARAAKPRLASPEKDAWSEF